MSLPQTSLRFQRLVHVVARLAFAVRTQIAQVLRARSLHNGLAVMDTVMSLGCGLPGLALPGDEPLGVNYLGMCPGRLPVWLGWTGGLYQR